MTHVRTCPSSLFLDLVHTGICIIDAGSTTTAVYQLLVKQSTLCVDTRFYSLQ